MVITIHFSMLLIDNTKQIAFANLTATLSDRELDGMLLSNQAIKGTSRRNSAHD